MHSIRWLCVVRAKRRPLANFVRYEFCLLRATHSLINNTWKSMHTPTSIAAAHLAAGQHQHPPHQRQCRLRRPVAPAATTPMRTTTPAMSRSRRPPAPPHSALSVCVVFVLTGARRCNGVVRCTDADNALEIATAVVRLVWAVCSFFNVLPPRRLMMCVT